MTSHSEKNPIQVKKSHSHVMTAALLGIYHSKTDWVEHSALYSILQQELFFEGKNKIGTFGKALRDLENRGWIESTILREQIPQVLVFKLTRRSEILFDLISEK